MSNLNLSVVILSHNTKDVTGRCLAKALAAKEYCEKKLKNKVEVIVLDNASADGSALAIKKDFPKVKLIAQKENLGFAKGNNLVMQKIKNPFILLLNSDCYLQEESLYKAIAYFRVNLNCDVLGARLNYASGLLQPSAGSLPNILNIIFWILGLSLLPFFNMIVSPFHPKEKKYFAKAHKTGWIMGAFFMLKKKVYDVTGGFDENFFMHMEEVEWCKRIWQKGYKIWYVPQVEVVHLHGASTNFDLNASFSNELKGIKYYLKKHYGVYYFILKPVLILGLILRMIAFSLLRKNKRARVYLEGLKAI